VGFFQPVFWVLILLGVMILIHELGHFWAALAVGIKVETFSLGFGPRLFGFRRGDTDYRVSAIPFGGYVRMLGELAAGVAADTMLGGAPNGQQALLDPRSFAAKPRWQRAIVVIAGPLMNILLAVGIITGIYMNSFPKEVNSVNPTISRVEAGSPAAEAGLKPGDKIVQLGGNQKPTWQDVMTQEALNANSPLQLVIERKGLRINVTVTPRMDPKEGIGNAGWMGDPDVQIAQVLPNSPAAAAGLKKGDLLISIDGTSVETPGALPSAVAKSGGRPLQVILMDAGHIRKVMITPEATHDSKLPWRIGIAFGFRGEFVKLPFGAALQESVRFNVKNGAMIFEALRSIIERRLSPKTLSGPIGIAKMSSEAAHEGALSYLFLMAVVSLNLAIFNLLPIPILDGGTLLMLLLEMVMQRELSLRVKETVFKLGFVFLMMIVVFVIYSDISKMLSNG
jgi:regulator of sigma E protease